MDMKTTKAQYKEEIKKLAYEFEDHCRKFSNDRGNAAYHTMHNIRNSIYLKYFNKYYVPSNATLTQLEGIYADLVNFASDYRIGR